MLNVLEAIIDEYGGRKGFRLPDGSWPFLPFEDQNPEIQEAMLIVAELQAQTELQNANQKS